MVHEELKEECLWVWEEEGGNTGPGKGRSDEDRPLPLLPPGCSAQPVWGFMDRSGQLFFEFHRVYRTEPVYRDGQHYLEDRLDPDLSYWAVTWTGRSANGDEFPAARWINYVQARKRCGPQLSYTRFSTQMGSTLPALLHTEDIELPPRARLVERVEPYPQLALS